MPPLPFVVDSRILHLARVARGAQAILECVGLKKVLQRLPGVAPLECQLIFKHAGLALVLQRVDGVCYAVGEGDELLGLSIVT